MSIDPLLVVGRIEIISPRGNAAHRDLNRIMDFERAPDIAWPKADMFINKSGELIIKVELTEIRSEDIEITAEADKLRIKGSRQDGDADTAAEVIRRDIPRGPYELLLKIPPGFNLSTAKAAFLHGTLRITVPANGTLPQAPRFSS